jgi:hypothetical protein
MLQSGTYFCHRTSNVQGLEWLEGLTNSIQLNYLIRSRTRDLQARSMVTQTLRYSVTVFKEYAE